MTRKRIVAPVALALVAFFAFDASAAPPLTGTLDPVTVTAAKTKADHEAIAAAYEAEARLAEQKAQMHDQMAKKYREFGVKPPWSAMAGHCRQLKRQYAVAAKLNRELAAEHHELATKLP